MPAVCSVLPPGSESMGYELRSFSDYVPRNPASKSSLSSRIDSTPDLDLAAESRGLAEGDSVLSSPEYWISILSNFRVAA